MASKKRQRFPSVRRPARAHPIHATGSPTQPDRPTPDPPKPLRLHLPLTSLSIFELYHTNAKPLPPPLPRRPS